MTPEFSLIAQYFHRDKDVKTKGLIVPNGDDGAVIESLPDSSTVVAIDTLVAGRHFFHDANPSDIGHKALAVNLSDLAAMGATPRYALLALTLPNADSFWLSEFSAGFYALADKFAVNLIGGDTTQGPLTVTVTVLGDVPNGGALTRSGAMPGDSIYVTGEIGTAGLALQVLQGNVNLSDDELALLSPNLHRPEPRISMGVALRDIASSCIDISDGLAADLGHILERSEVGTDIELDCLPLHKLVRQQVVETGRWHLPLSSGDDYELCFTVPTAKASALADCLSGLRPGSPVPFTRIGTVTDKVGVLRCLQADGSSIPIIANGYDHFE